MRATRLTRKPLAAESFVHPITSAFLLAAAELAFSFEPAFVLELPDGVVVENLGLVRDFGSKKGTLIFARDTAPTATVRAQLGAEGYFSSELFSSYETYDRGLFASTLNDWRWFGPESSQPSWYTGNGGTRALVADG